MQSFNQLGKHIVGQILVEVVFVCGQPIEDVFYFGKVLFLLLSHACLKVIEKQWVHFAGSNVSDLLKSVFGHFD